MENITTVETHETVKFAEVNDTCSDNRDDIRSDTGKPIEKMVLCVDIGYGNTKIVWGRDHRHGHRQDQDEGDEWDELCFKSLAPKVRTDESGPVSGLRLSMDRVSIPINGAHYLIGPDAHYAGGGAILGADFILRDQYLALLRGSIYYAMTRSGLLRRHIDVLVLGLPVANWKPKQAELMKIGSGPHPIPVPIAQRAQFGETLSVTVGKVIVVPQPVGALQHAVMNLPRTELRHDKRVRMVIDPGYNTFDWFVSVGVRPDLQRCGSLQGGVSQLLKLVANAAGARLGVGTLNLKEVEDGLASGSMLTQGKKLDMKEFEPIAQDEAREVVDRFLNAIDASLKIDIIHLTGGGASFYIKALRDAFPGYDIQVEPGTVMANARGFYLIGKTLADMK